VHDVARTLPDGDRDQLAELLEARLGEVGLPEGWTGERERQRALRMVAKLAEYAAQARRAGRSLVAVEQNVQVRLGELTVSGQVDRLEVDDQGRLVVVDLKTSTRPPSKTEVERHAQLGVYQLAVTEGGFEAVAPGVRTSGGAHLVQLGSTTKSVGVQSQPPLAADPEPDWARTLLETVAAGMTQGEFEARNGKHCRMCAVKRSCPAQLEGRQVTP
jgi:RecB family exonuclease